MTQDVLVKTIGRGYTSGHAFPLPLSQPVIEKLQELAENSPNKAIWQAYLKGFEMGIEDQKKERLKTLKKGRGRETRGRSK